jgi:L-fuculose-phosphate aldolase
MDAGAPVAWQTARMTDLRTALVAGARAVAESGLVVGSAGNLSVRAGDAMLITPRGSRLEAVDPAHCVEVDLATDEVAADASSETPLHRAVYAATDAGAIVHTHSTFATVQSTLVDELPAVHYAITAFGGPVRVAPYATFGSDELAAAVAAALDGRRAALLANHGAVVVADTVADAVDLAVQLEWLCSVSYHATLAGTPTVLDDEQLAAVVEQSRALRYGTAARA